MSILKKITIISMVLFCFATFGTAFAADMFTINGTVVETGTNPNMIVIDDGAQELEVYGIKFSFLENNYDIFVDVGMDVSIEAYENVCYDGTVRLKAASITVDDETIDFQTTGARGKRNRVD